MHLWNDYEGTLFAGQWKLSRLLRTEGRSALFATARNNGEPAVLRLTEALNDQSALQARNRAIQAAGDEYLVRIESFGDGELDGTPMSYALLEQTEESLADILPGRRLDPDEVHEVAVSVAGGLSALHAQGLVHGFVEPESVLAAGNRIKLRSDCARWAPAPEDMASESAVTAQTDALGLAGVIVQSLTQQRLHDASDALALPEPFSTIVRNTARNVWGVPEIQAELVRYSRAHAPAVPALIPAPVSAPVLAPAPVLAAPEPIENTAPRPSPAPSAASPATTTTATLAAAAASTDHEPASPTIPRPLSSRATTVKIFEATGSSDQPGSTPAAPSTRWLLPAVGAAALVLLLLFFSLHRAKAPVAGPNSHPVYAPSAGNPAPVVSTRAPAPVAPLPAAAVAPPTTAQPGTKVWRVIAYTYNRRGEAAAKAAFLNARHPGFDAQVWSRTGERPFLVTLGGSLSEGGAFALRARARKAGLARDIYAQNYSH